ncbi:hypothetical protein ABE493_00680 [Stenotrophomonas terrae]|uniref:hypothetical protein n=1 Tax=Stenotrophomonas terrae TaxID=405446 RepID=UPI00320BB478
MKHKKVKLLNYSLMLLVAGAVAVTMIKKAGNSGDSASETAIDSNVVRQATESTGTGNGGVARIESSAGTTTSPNSRGPGSSNPFPNIPRSRAGLSLADDPFGPQSIEEQQWLDRRGYPNARQWEIYSQLPDGLLQVAADSGDSVAKTMLDARGLPSRNATDKLLLSAANGDDFALSLLSARLASLPGEQNLIDAYAVARVSEIRGNTSAAIGREAMFAQSLTPDQRMKAEENAMMLVSKLNALYEKKYGVRYQVDARPFSIGNKGI